MILIHDAWNTASQRELEEQQTDTHRRCKDDLKSTSHSSHLSSILTVYLQILSHT